tara:strand:- start:473 stop:745 length:273 start_codon:yes stop_codon:yes gene_type:complete
MKNLMTIIFLAIAATGCGVESNPDYEETRVKACWTGAADYIRTDFDCGTHSVEYVICDNPGGIERENCTEAWEAPETFMGHCHQWNVCEG